MAESTHFSARLGDSVVDVEVFSQVEGDVGPQIFKVGCEVDVRCSVGEVDAVGLVRSKVYVLPLLLGHSREGLFSIRCCGDRVVLFVYGVVCRVEGWNKR